MAGICADYRARGLADASSEVQRRAAGGMFSRNLPAEAEPANPKLGGQCKESLNPSTLSQATG